MRGQAEVDRVEDREGEGGEVVVDVIGGLELLLSVKGNPS